MAKKKLTPEQEYDLLTQEEQVLLRPDTMIGSTEEQTDEQWAFNFDTNKIEKQELTYIPAYLKLFNEILTNASDHAQRGKKVKTIKVNIDKDWRITVWNDGEGIPVKIHKEHKMYIPEMVLGKLNSGSNYNDDEKRYGAGRNGVGSGLVALFSDNFIIDCADGKKKYYQELSNNAKDKTDPIIKAYKKSYTSVSYITDHKRLPIKKYADDTLKMCVKQIYDIAVYNPNIKIYFNDVEIKINTINDWIKLHTDSDEVFIDKIDDKWEVGLVQSDTDSFEHCSIVNGNTTWQGGTHVDMIMNNIIKRLSDDLTKGKKGIKIRPSEIKNRFHLFLVSKIANPAFDTQTKVNLKTKIKDKVDLSEKTYKALKKSKIIESILEWVELRQQAQLKKLNKKAAGKTIRVEKLVDAHKAGTTQGHKAMCFIAEGDSAKNSAMNGLAIIGRDYCGIYPVRGRVLNVRDVAPSKIIKNKEIADIIKILGLVPGKKYTDLKDLRYGKVVFFTDSDVFGISIKGLLLNFIHKMWPELLDLGFCFEFITPIVKATKGKIVKDYYDLDKYIADRDNGKLDSFKIKYFKGLGTIQKKEMQEMFKNIDKHLIPFIYDSKRDSDKIDLVFNKTRANERKDWMLKFKASDEIVPDKLLGSKNHINEFIDNEFIQFTNYDNVISIPDIMDGLKPSQRKILFGCFKKNLTKEIKVAQLGAYVSEVSEYHHGETNLFGTIVNMAQDFVFANNINILMPNGEFGSRRDPKASAAPRYIFTELNPITKYIYRKEDECILNYLTEEGQSIEPEFYLPIIPMVLVNGSSGIGTGWSTDIPKFDPISLIEVIKRKLKKPKLKYAINPYYIGWNGDYEFDADRNTYITYGIYTKKKDIVHITELPVDTSTDKYISNLDKLVDDKKIKKYIDNSNNDKIDIKIHLNHGQKGDIVKLLKLSNNVSINNMLTWFNGNITRWESAEELLNTWFDERLQYYEKRKKEWTKLLEEKYNKYLNLFKFIKLIVTDELIINKKKIDLVVKELEEFEFDKIDDKYDYLLSLPAYSFTKEKYDYYKNIAKQHKEALKEYKTMTIEELWLKELKELESKI